MGVRDFSPSRKNWKAEGNVHSRSRNQARQLSCVSSGACWIQRFLHTKHWPSWQSFLLRQKPFQVHKPQKAQYGERCFITLRAWTAHSLLTFIATQRRPSTPAAPPALRGENIGKLQIRPRGCIRLRDICNCHFVRATPENCSGTGTSRSTAKQPR